MPYQFHRTAILNLFLYFFLLSHAYAAEPDLNITEGNPLIIGVPAYPFSKEFVQINPVENSENKRYTGFCIRVFEEVLKMLEYKILYKFVEFDGSYNDLITSVSNKTFDAAVGDITIFAHRWKLVEFTEPFTESGLSMVVPMKPPEKWIFFRPFNDRLWIATGGILVYTMFVVWFLEHRSNPEFNGPWHAQLGNALWFTFTSLFFAHRENIRNSHTRVVVVVWLFVVLILTQSYTASLTSMLTVTRLNPNIESLRMHNAKVGCDENTFMQRFVENELNYKSENIKPMVYDEDYLKAFNNGSISAAFLEIPYAKLFVNSHCEEFTVTGSSIRFGGLSFAFHKRLSTIAYDVSEAILKLSENGILKRLEESWLNSSSAECSDSQATNKTDSLSLQSFWGLYIFSVTISTACFLLFVARLLKDYRHYRQSQASVLDENVWNNMVGILNYLKNAEPGGFRRAPSSSKEFQMFKNPIM